MTPRLAKRLPSWFREIAGAFRTHSAIALVLGFVSSCCATLLMFVAGYLISKTAWPGVTLFMVMVPVAFVQLFGIGRPLARYFERLVSHDWVFRVTSTLRAKLFSAAQAASGNPSRSKATGDYLSLLADDIGHLQNLYLRVAFPAVIAFAFFVASCVFCGFFDIVLGLAAFAFGCASLIAIPAITYLATKVPEARARTLKAREYATLTDDVMGSVDWALAGRSAEAATAHEESARKLYDAESSVRNRVRIAEAASALLVGVSACAFTCIAASAFDSTSDSVHYIAAFALGLFPLMELYASMPGAMPQASTHMTSITRIDEFVSSTDETAHDDHLNNSDGTAMAQNGDIHLSGVNYRYPNARSNALCDVGLTIPSGQHVAVIGPSGSGKSTLAAIIQGSLIPSGGYVEIGGVRTPRARESVCRIPQRAHIFDDTLRNNLTLGSSGASDAEIEHALGAVGLKGKLESLEGGLDAHVGETGIGFSGGEEHRVSLARALLSNRPVVLLDEPFSAVDPATERDLIETLSEAFSDRTLFVITHHLVGIAAFDRVLLMRDGSIVADGSPEGLARDNEHVRALLEFDRASALG